MITGISGSNLSLSQSFVGLCFQFLVVPDDLGNFDPTTDHTLAAEHDHDAVIEARVHFLRNVRLNTLRPSLETASEAWPCRVCDSSFATKRSFKHIDLLIIIRFLTRSTKKLVRVVPLVDLLLCFHLEVGRTDNFTKCGVLHTECSQQAYITRCRNVH